ncbi:MAG TPA: hypothetical protein VFH60_01465 [Chloroflexia bacterium]|nr:hypothetical protein [Chloroflexia bacterium]
MKIRPILGEIQSICRSLGQAQSLRSADVGDQHGLRSAYRQLVLSSLAVIRDLCTDIEDALQLEIEDLAARSMGHSIEDPFDANPY